MRVLLLLALFLPAAFAAPPRVRLLSVADNTARIRVSDGSPEVHISSLVHALHSAGINAFIFEAKSEILLNKLKSRWLDTGVRDVTILPPSPPSATDFPKLDPIEAAVTLRQIDHEITTESKIFNRNRQELINFVFENGIPETDDTITLTDLLSQKEQSEKELSRFMSSTPDDQLKQAGGIDLPGNPVAKHLKAHRIALEKSNQLRASGYGPKHPSLIAATEEVEATRQMALDELGSIEEGFRVKIYQLEKRIAHFPAWQKLTESAKQSLTRSFQEKTAAYENSLHRILRMKSAKEAAERSMETIE
jgi:hypothetical protein